MKKIVVCMGSSCFSRGNNRNLEKLQSLIADGKIDAAITIKGCRCGNVCRGGPNIWVDDALVPGMDEEKFDEFLKTIVK